MRPVFGLLTIFAKILYSDENSTQTKTGLVAKPVKEKTEK